MISTPPKGFNIAQYTYDKAFSKGYSKGVIRGAIYGWTAYMVMDLIFYFAR